jgi:primase-polymerase (primpol)-like protein
VARFETRDGQRASTTNPATWSSFADTCAATDRVRANGIGFVFSGDDNIIGVDLDHVRDPATESVKPWARGVIDTLQSYTELSPSGAGCHVVLRGTKPPGSQCNLRFDPLTHEGFEMYSTVAILHDHGQARRWHAGRSALSDGRRSHPRVIRDASQATEKAKKSSPNAKTRSADDVAVPPST